MKQNITNGASVLLPIVMTGASGLSASITDPSDGRHLATLQSEAFNGVSELRLDAVLATIVHDGVALASFPVRKYQAHNVSVIVNGITYTLTRQKKLGALVCSSKRTFVKYSGLELTIPFCYNNGRIDCEADGELVFNSQNIDYEFANEWGVFSFVVENERSVIFTTNGSQAQVSIIHKNAPEDPFYLRWLNQYGGWEYHMFSCKRKHSVGLTANDYYEDYDGVKRAYNKDGKEAVEASSGVVDRETLDALVWMPLSPDIRLYKKDTQEWVPVQIEDGDTELYNDQPTGELLFSFVVNS